MPTKNTSVVHARVADTKIKEIEKRCKNRGMTINSWLNWAIDNGLRPHRRK